jgi:hypothetical protein
MAARVLWSAAGTRGALNDPRQGLDQGRIELCPPCGSHPRESAVEGFVRRARLATDQRLVHAGHPDDPRRQRDALPGEPVGPAAVEALPGVKDPRAGLLGDARAEREAAPRRLLRDDLLSLLRGELVQGSSEERARDVELADLVQPRRLADQLAVRRSSRSR